MKTLLKIVAALIVIVIIALLVVVLRINGIAKAGIERGGEYALGVPTAVDKVDISLLGGTVGLEGLQVSNAPGFDPAPYLMRNTKFNFGINTGSIMSDTIEVDLIELDGLDFYIVKKDGKDNIKPILDHLKKFEGGEKAQEETGSSKKLIVKKIVIKNITAHVDLPVVGQKTVTLGEDIVLENVTQDNAKGMVMSEIMARIFPMITAAVVQSLGDILPGDLMASLNGGLADVADQLGGNVGEMIKNPGKMLEDVAGQAGEAVNKAVEDATKNIGEDAGKAVEDAGEKVKEGIGNIFGGNNE